MRSKMNKDIHREADTSTKIFDNRSVEKDYATLVPLLREGLQVLDVGCGTGAISAGIARYVGAAGSVIGIDNTESFIRSGEKTYRDVSSLKLIHADLFNYQPEEKFDLVVAARVLQWLSNPVEALRKLGSLLKPGGQLSILDYNHEALEWQPEPPESMRAFYRAFLKWRSNAGMDNRIAENLADYFKEAGFHSLEVFVADEVSRKGDPDFLHRVGIWSKVAELKQIQEEGYVSDSLRTKAIEEYNAWTATNAEAMTMKLKEVRGRI